MLDIRRSLLPLLLVMVGGCVGSGAVLPTPSSVLTNEATVIGDPTVTFSGVPGAACPPASVAGVVRAYVDAFNRGDQVALGGIFERGVLFTAWNPAPRGAFVSSGRQQLLDYFAERHAQHDTLRLTALHIQYGSDRVGLAPTIERRADDITTEVATAKAELDCPSRVLTAWNQGGWARSPSSIPIGFALPTRCRLVGVAILLPDATEWRIDCGPEGNRDVRSALEPALVQQGWVLCARAATPAWSKPLARVLSIAQPSPSSAELPRLIEQFQTLTNCPY